MKARKNENRVCNLTRDSSKFRTLFQINISIGSTFTIFFIKNDQFRERS